ncbi:MAG: hypothetical protein ACLR2E_24615 [Lachnospiraceae bacterium]
MVRIHTFIGAAVKLYAVDTSHIVDIYHITFCNLALCYLKKLVVGVAVIVILLLNVILSHIQRRNSYFQAFILTQGHIVKGFVIRLIAQSFGLSCGLSLAGSFCSCLSSVFCCCSFCLCYGFCLGLRSVSSCISGCCYAQAQ